MIKQLSDTSIYKYADEIKHAEISNRIKGIIMAKQGTVYITPEMLDDVIYKMRHKSFNFSAKFAVLDLYQRGVIKLLYNETNRVTSSVPYFKVKKPHGGYGIIINISNFSTMNDDSSISMNPVILYTLMLSGALSLIIDKHITSLIPGVSILYARLFTDVIARMETLDTIKRAKVQFIANKFFLMQCGIDEVSAAKRSMNDIKNIDEYLLNQTDLALPVDVYANLENLVSGIQTVFPEFTGFKFGLFFDRWIRSYGEMSSFAIEYIPFFYTLIIALVCNANSLINIRAIEKEASKDNKDLIRVFNNIENFVIALAKK